MELDRSQPITISWILYRRIEFSCTLPFIGSKCGILLFAHTRALHRVQHITHILFSPPFTPRRNGLVPVVTANPVIIYPHTSAIIFNNLLQINRERRREIERKIISCEKSNVFFYYYFESIYGNIRLS